MKVLIYSTYRPDMHDGASTSGRGLVEELRRHKVDVTVCTTDRGWLQNHIDGHNDKLENCHLFHAWFSHILDISPSLMLYFCKTIKSFDLIHFRGVFSFPTVFGSFVAQWFKKPYIISPVGDRIPFWDERSAISHGTIKYFYFKLLIRMVLMRASYIVCTSEMELNRILSMLGNNNRGTSCASESTFGIAIPDGIAIPNALDENIYLAGIGHVSRAVVQTELGIACDKSIYLFLGRLSREKALEFLLEAWEKVVGKKKNSVLVIAGGGRKLHEEYIKSLRKIVATMKFPKSVIFPGPVSGELKLALLRYSCCLLLPSYSESFGMVVLEALFNGIPVLASKGTPWECLENEKLGRWLPWDTDLWAEAMINVANMMESTGQAFLLKSRKWITENFGWEKTTKKYIEIYNQVVNRTLESRKRRG
ncbi:MAG: glycosyltransferase family 4 protein [Dehalococcoidia bacterium]|jgi:glycosyltransferase involved in cell wall biosynthesis